MEAFKNILASGEKHVAMVRYIPQSWQSTREAWGHRPRLWNITSCERKRRCCLWFRTLTTNGTQQLFSGVLFIFQANQINVGNSGEYPLWFAVLHAHGKKFSVCSSWVLDKSRGPFWLRVKRVQIIGGKNSDRLLCLDSGFVHLQHKIGTSKKIPSLVYDGVACVLKLPGNPLSPLAVSFIVADEKIFVVLFHTDYFHLPIVTSLLLPKRKYSSFERINQSIVERRVKKSDSHCCYEFGKPLEREKIVKRLSWSLVKCEEFTDDIQERRKAL